MLKLADVKKIFQQYPITSEVIKAVPFGEGHINNTYLVTLKNKKSYILQIINDQIFHPVSKLMENYVSITKFYHQEVVKKGGDSLRETINVVFTKNKKSYIKYKDYYVRLLLFIDHTTALQIIKKPKDFYYAAIAFANFYKVLAKFNANKLYEIIPNFHNTQVRYKNFLKAVNLDKMKRAKTCQKEIKFIANHSQYYSLIVNMLKKKEIPTRVTHNDTKLNNVLFDAETNCQISYCFRC